jgi:pimeloyl-ACP methyl ester carboxylesterase
LHDVMTDLPDAIPESSRVPVDGGELTVLRWPGHDPDAPTVVAAHGITANALAWARVAQASDGRVTLLAPDLRGRAGSAHLPGPFGIASHARDLVAVLDAWGLKRAVLAGHSMGAFVAATAAVIEPTRVSSLVLVDGGLGFPTPAGTDIDAVLHAVIGPAMQRLAMTFPDRQAYREFWRAHPALADTFDDVVDAHVQRDLVGAEPELRSSCALAAVRQDGADVVAGESTLRAVHEATAPTLLLWAPRGLRDEPGGLYTAERLAAAGLDPARVRTEMVDDVNHYTILLGEHGARAVADRLAGAALPRRS